MPRADWEFILTCLEDYHNIHGAQFLGFVIDEISNQIYSQEY